MMSRFISFKRICNLKLIFVLLLLLLPYSSISLSESVEISFSQDYILKWHTIFERSYP